jgi:UDP-N-acetylglucosamine 3-dehydrogenase
VAGSRAILTTDSTEPATLDLVGSADQVPNLASGTSPYERELAHFVRCIATGEESVVKPEDAYEALRISLAATESIVEGKPVTLGGRP